MPRRMPAPPPPPDEDYEEPEVVSEKMGNAVELSEAIAGKAERAVVTELNPATKEQEYLTTVPIEEYSFEWVRDQFGGGRYVVMFLNENGKIVTKSVFTVSNKYKGAVGAAGLPSGSPATPGMSPELAMMIGQMSGFKALIEAQGVMMGKAFEALAGRAGGEKKEGKDPIDVGLEIARIIKDASAPPERMGIKDLAESFREGIEFGRMAGGVASGDTGFGEVVKVFGPPVAKAIESAIETDKAAKGQPAAIAPPQPAAQVAPPKQPAGPMIDLQKAPWLVHLRPFFSEIGPWIQNGWDAAAFGRSVADRLPDNILDEIEVVAKDPQFIERSISALPAQMQAYKAWFTAALEALKEEALAEDDETPAAPAGPKLHEDDDDDGPGSGSGQQ